MYINKAEILAICKDASHEPKSTAASSSRVVVLKHKCQTRALVVVLVVNLVRAVVSSSPVRTVVLAVGVERSRSSRLAYWRRVVRGVHSRALYFILAKSLLKSFVDLPVKQRGLHKTVAHPP